MPLQLISTSGVSFLSISKKANEKWVAIIVCVIGTLLAIFTPINKYESFLYFIGSVFAPMIAILITDYFILKKDNSHKKISILNAVLWFIGFVTYRLFMSLDTLVGNTLPVMIITGILCIIVHKIKGEKNV